MNALPPASDRETVLLAELMEEMEVDEERGRDESIDSGISNNGSIPWIKYDTFRQVQHNSGIRQSGLPMRGLNNGATVQGRYPQVQHEDNRRHILDSHMSIIHLKGVVYGTKDLVKKFAVEIGIAQIGSGVVLDMASDVLSLKEQGCTYKCTDDFIILKQFDGKKVYLCIDHWSHRLFILKVVPLENIQGSIMIRRRQQVDIPLTLQGDCPYIAKIFGLIKVNDSGQDSVQILMEFCTGGSLSDMNLLCKWTSEEFAKFFENLLKVLAYLHNYKIVHGDLKLDNICMADETDPRSLRLIDFESVKHPQHPNNFFGTIQYLPPWYNEIKLQPKWNKIMTTMDVWAAGIILIVFLMKHFPWDEEYKNLQRNAVFCMHQPCHHVKSVLLRYIINHPREIEKYYPIISAETSGPLRWLCDLVFQLLPSTGDRRCQRSPAEILENQETALVSTNKFSTRENQPLWKKLLENPDQSAPNWEPPDNDEHLPDFEQDAAREAHIVEVEVFYHGPGRIYSRQVNIRRGLKLKELIELPQMREMREQFPALGFDFYIEKHSIHGRSQVLTYGGYSIDSDCFLELWPTIHYI